MTDTPTQPNRSRTIEERLRHMEARADIADLVARYALGADRKNDPLILGPLFADDASWSAEGFQRFEGRLEIETGLAQIAAERVVWSIHYMVSPLITLTDDGRHGKCQWYLWELCSMRNGGIIDDQWLGGWYDGDVVEIAGVWKFQKVVLDIRLQGSAVPPFSVKKSAP